MISQNLTLGHTTPALRLPAAIGEAGEARIVFSILAAFLAGGISVALYALALAAG